jgi:hypothetical protein
VLVLLKKYEGGKGKLLNEELHKLYSSPNIIKEGEVERACNTHGEKSNAYRTLVGKPAGNILRGRPRRRCEDNIKMDLREIGWCGMDWINLTQGRDRWRALVNMVMTLWVT